jgi:hypothetical protein
LTISTVAIAAASSKEAVGDILEEKTGGRPEWPDGAEPAPEHERGGNA